MLRILILTGLVLALGSSYAQVSKSIQFREEVFNFGSVEETGGPVTHEFVFTNVSGRPVKILSVQPSCGCTIPSWSKEPIAAGKVGMIQARFDPKGRPGYFTKTLTVTADSEQAPIVLQIKGQVTTGKTTVATDFPSAKGNWKLKASVFNMGTVYKKEATIKEFPVVNGGTKAITVEHVTAPAYITVEVLPSTLLPGTKGVVKVSYNAKQNYRYGFQSDNVEIHTDDDQQPVKSFSVNATLEDYFAPLSPDDLIKAPQLKLNVTALDFGRLTAGATAVREVPFTNSGKKELVIKAVQGNCVCVQASATKTTLKAGETSTVKITFTPQDRPATQQKAITIYSNDPQNPVQRVTFSVYVVNQ